MKRGTTLIPDPNLAKLAGVMARNMAAAFREGGLVACKLGEGGVLVPASAAFDENCRRFAVAWCASFAKSLDGHAVKKV